MLHVVSAMCVARDLHTMALRPLECAYLRHFAAQWDYKNSWIAPFSLITIIIIIITFWIRPLASMDQRDHGSLVLAKVLHQGAGGGGGGKGEETALLPLPQ